MLRWRWLWLLLLALQGTACTDHGPDEAVGMVVPPPTTQGRPLTKGPIVSLPMYTFGVDSIEALHADDATENPDTLSGAFAADNVFTVDKSVEMRIQWWDVDVIPNYGIITDVTLHLQYGAEDGYTGTQAIEYVLDGTSTPTTLVPTDIAGWSPELTFEILSGGARTPSSIHDMEIYFHNNDSGGANAIHFDYAWLTIFWEEPGFEQSAFRWFTNVDSAVPSFGGTGCIYLNIQDNQRIVIDGSDLYVGGNTLLGTDFKWLIQKRDRLTGDLVLDFGAQGIAESDIGTELFGGLVYDSGSLIAVGVDDSSNWRLEKRSATTGDLVNGFGTGGVVTAAATSESAVAIAIDSSYLYLVGTDSGADWRLEKRSLSTGAPDSGFGTSGVVTGANGANAQAIAIDGSLMVVVGTDSGNDWRIEKRQLTDGALVPTFGVGGVMTGNAATGEASAVVTDGTSIYVGGNDDTGAWRIEKRDLGDGNLVTAFGGDGVVDDAGTNALVHHLLVSGSTAVATGWVESQGWRIESRDSSTGALTLDSPPFIGAASISRATWSIAVDGSLYTAGTVASMVRLGQLCKRSLVDGRLDTGTSEVGAPLAAQDSPAVAPTRGTPFRLRLLLHVHDMEIRSGYYVGLKLQVAPLGLAPNCASVGTANFVDVDTASGDIQFFDNPIADDGDDLVASVDDPQHGTDPVTYLANEEANDFNVSSVALDEDGLVDFTLVDVSSPDNTDYCFRVVYADGSPLSFYSVYPRITAGSGGVINAPPVITDVTATPAAIQLLDTSTTTVSCSFTDADAAASDTFRVSLLVRSPDDTGTYILCANLANGQSCAGTDTALTVTGSNPYVASVSWDPQGLLAGLYDLQCVVRDLDGAGQAVTNPFADNPDELELLCAPTDATCDNVDDDCSGSADEDYVATPTNCGVGACASVGVTSCVAGSVEDSCVPGSPAADDATCDNVDDDCSGSADEDYVSIPTNCGVGACASAGVTTCVAGSVEDSCVAGSPAADDATCDNVDDDCDGSADEDYVSVATCGVGLCRTTNTPSACVLGVETPCTAGQPSSTVDDTCDGIDDDCDGFIDEEISLTESCPAPANFCEVTVCGPVSGTCEVDRISECCIADGDCATASTCIQGQCSAGQCVYGMPQGCCNNDGDCEDGNACTLTGCETSTGQCTRQWEKACCLTHADCDDADPCSYDECTADHRCQFRPTQCETVGPCGADVSCVTSSLVLSLGEGSPRQTHVAGTVATSVFALDLANEALAAELTRLSVEIVGPSRRSAYFVPSFYLYVDTHGDGLIDEGSTPIAQVMNSSYPDQRRIEFDVPRLPLGAATTTHLLVAVQLTQGAQQPLAHGYLAPPGVAPWFLLFVLSWPLLWLFATTGLGRPRWSRQYLGLAAAAMMVVSFACARAGFDIWNDEFHIVLPSNEHVEVTTAAHEVLWIRGAPVKGHPFVIRW